MNTLKKKLPNLLVGSSIFCLVVFLVIWNLRQYEQAEDALKRELSFHLESASNEIHQKQITTFMKRLDIQVPSKGSTRYFPTLKKDTATEIVVWIDSLSSSAESFFEVKKDTKQLWGDTLYSRFGNTNNTTILKSARFDTSSYKFPDKLDGGELFTWFTSNRLEKEFAKTLDLFVVKLNDNELPADFEQESDSITPSPENLVLTYQSPNLTTQHKNIYFKNYGTYLLTKITPSLLFSGFLLTLVIIAFGVVMKSLKQQQKIVNIKNDFISNMTHELKTPISTVSVAIEAIRRYDVLQDKEKTEEYLDISSNELGRLSLLVEKVLRTTLFESGKGFLNLQPVDLTKIVQETLHTMKMHFEERQVRLITDILNHPLWVMGDKVHLTNVVYNLIENAVKYSKEDIQITVITKQSASGVTLSISDNGIGIPAEHQKQIFTKFYRVPNQNNRHNVKGHGLGLSYVKQVVDELGGSIDLESQEGKGTSFKIHLKAAKA